MPRKTIHRFLPNINKLLDRPSLQWIKSLAKDPNLFHLNRHSVSLGVAVGIFCAFLPLPGQTFIAAEKGTPVAIEQHRCNIALLSISIVK